MDINQYKYELTRTQLGEDSNVCTKAFDQIDIEGHKINVVIALQKALDVDAFGSYDNFVAYGNSDEYMYQVAQFNFLLIREFGFNPDVVSISDLCTKFQNIQPIVYAIREKSYRENVHLCLELFRQKLWVNQ